MARRQHWPELVVQNCGPTHIMAAAPPTPSRPSPAPSTGKMAEVPKTPVPASRAKPPDTTGKLTRRDTSH